MCKLNRKNVRIVETEKISTERDISQNFLVSTNLAEITVYVIFNFFAIEISVVTLSCLSFSLKYLRYKRFNDYL